MTPRTRVAVLRRFGSKDAKQIKSLHKVDEEAMTRFQQKLKQAAAANDKDRGTACVSPVTPANVTQVVPLPSLW